MLRIGELATRTRRSVHTLRYYESQGLMPNVERDAGGRRVYQSQHVEWVDLLGRLRRTGMSIQQVREYATLVERGDATLGERQELLRRHRARIVDLMDDLRRSLGLVDRKIRLYGEWIEAGGSPFGVPSPDADEQRDA